MRNACKTFLQKADGKKTFGRKRHKREELLNES
jgi:hypothetical protein